MLETKEDQEGIAGPAASPEAAAETVPEVAQKHETYDGIVEGQALVPGPLINAILFTIATSIILTWPLWGDRDPAHLPADRAWIPVHTFLNTSHSRPWWDIGFLLIISWIAFVMLFIVYAIKRLPRPGEAH
jgi:hypothetical protein